MGRLVRDARFAVRLFGRAPGFTSLAIVVLALGISSTTAIFSVVYGTFFAPLPYRDADALVMVWSQFRGERVSVSAKDFVAWRRAASAFSDLNAWGGRSVNLATADRPENLQAGVATPGFLAMMGYGHPLALGRSFVEEEGTVGRDRAVILTYRVWRHRSFRRRSGHRGTAGSARQRTLHGRRRPGRRGRPTTSRGSCGCRWRSRRSSWKATVTR